MEDNRPWKKKQKIGIPVRSIEEIKRAHDIGFNTVELRLNEFDMYQYNGPHEKWYHTFTINHDFLKEIQHVLQILGLSNQFHARFNEHADMYKDEGGINMAIASHHKTGFQRERMFEEIYRLYGLGGIRTEHPPIIFAGDEQFISEYEGLQSTRRYIKTLDYTRLSRDYKVRVCYENMPGPTAERCQLGYLFKHLQFLFEDTITYGITIDSGHRILSLGNRVTEILGLFIPWLVCHFHDNNKNTDDHLLPFGNRKTNIVGRKHFISSFRRWRPSVIIEVKMRKFTNDILRNFYCDFEKELS